jgi:hypothetical protein
MIIIIYYPDTVTTVATADQPIIPSNASNTGVFTANNIANDNNSGSFGNSNSDYASAIDGYIDNNTTNNTQLYSQNTTKSVTVDLHSVSSMSRLI